MYMSENFRFAVNCEDGAFGRCHALKKKHSATKYIEKILVFMIIINLKIK